MFEKIIVLALDPSMETTLRVERLVGGQSNAVAGESRDLSGRAAGVMRVLWDYRIKPTMVLLAGARNRLALEDCLAEEQWPHVLVEVEGYTREDIAVVAPGAPATQLCRQGFAVPYEALEALREQLDKLVTAQTLVVITGKLPTGISPRLLQQICGWITAAGAKVALDIPCLGEEDLAAIRPWLVKPNREEINKLAKRQMSDVDELLAYGASLVDMGVEHCLISMERDGLMYLGRDTAWEVQVPDVDVVSQAGVGDSCFAGFIVAIQQELPLERAVKMAAAMGTAACLRPGNIPPKHLVTANLLMQSQAKQLYKH